MADEEFFSFDEALNELHLKEEELKRLVSEGEIRAFREGETMRLRRKDVANLRNELSGGEVVDLGTMSDELVFEDDADFEAGMATEEISDADTILEDDDVEDVGEVDLEEDFGDLEPVGSGAASAPVRRATALAGAGQAAGAEDEPTWVRAVMILTAFLLVLGVPLCLSISRGRASDFSLGIAKMFGFGGD